MGLFNFFSKKDSDKKQTDIVESEIPETNSLEVIFSGYEIPKELIQVFNFDQSECLNSSFSEGFEFARTNDKLLISSWSNNEQFMEKLIPFGQASAGGSEYVLWLTENSLSNCPVLIFGDEGGVHCIADNIKELLRILSFDSEPIVGHKGVRFVKNENKSPMNSNFRTLLSGLGIKPVSELNEIEKIISEADRKYGSSFKEWLSQYV